MRGYLSCACVRACVRCVLLQGGFDVRVFARVCLCVRVYVYVCVCVCVYARVCVNFLNAGSHRMFPVQLLHLEILP